jgi:hypothetical protein
MRAIHARIRGSSARDGAICSRLSPVPQTSEIWLHIRRRSSSSYVQSTSSLATVRAIDA